MIGKKRSPRAGIANTFKRSQEKQVAVLTWLAEFHYSTLDILSRYLGVRRKGQVAFFSRLVQAQLLRAIPVPLFRSKLYMLTPTGKTFALRHTERALKYSTEPSKIAYSHVHHNLLTQYAVLRRLTPGAEVTFNRHLPAVLPKMPDAIITTGERTLALELELNHKSTPRVQHAFFQHALAMRDGHYQHCEYVFDSDNLCKLYQKKFDEPEFPIYRTDKKRRLCLTDNDLVLRPEERTQFSFTIERFFGVPARP